MTRIKTQILYLLISIVPEALQDAMLIPLYPFMIRFYLPDIPESQVGSYTGLLISSFYFPLFLMNLVWGKISDKYVKLY